MLYYFISGSSDLNNNDHCVSQLEATEVLHVIEQKVELLSTINSMFNHTVTSE